MKELVGEQLKVIVTQMKEKLKNYVEDKNESFYKKDEPNQHKSSKKFAEQRVFKSMTIEKIDLLSEKQEIPEKVIEVS